MQRNPQSQLKQGSIPCLSACLYDTTSVHVLILQGRKTSVSFLKAYLVSDSCTVGDLKCIGTAVVWFARMNVYRWNQGIIWGYMLPTPEALESVTSAHLSATSSISQCASANHQDLKPS